MKICDLTSGSSRLQKATKELHDAWMETRRFWDDQTAIEFEEKFLNPILPHIRLMFAEVNELRETLEKAERACRDEETDID